LENALEEIGRKLGSSAKRHIMKQMEKGTFYFLGGIHNHWKRIEALSRRFAVLGEDEYDYLRPIGDIIMMLRENLFTSIINEPVCWTAVNATDEMKQSSIDSIANVFNKNLYHFIKETMWNKQMSEWKKAILHSGTGSTIIRARDMQSIYKNTIPVPDDFQLNSKIVNELYKILKHSIEECGW
jgi:hypothetical protein